MSCLVQRNNKGKITNILTKDGIPSQTFKAVYSNPFTGTTDTVYKIITNIYSDKVEKMYEGVSDERFVYPETQEPRIYLKDSKGNLVEDIETSIIANNIGVFEIGILNPTNSEFVKISKFNTNASVVSKGITDGIATGTVSPQRVITKDGDLKFKGKGIYEADIKSTARIFKQDFESATGIFVKVDDGGTFEIKNTSNFVEVTTKSGGSTVMSKQDALSELATNSSITNKAEVVVASFSEVLSTPYNRVTQNSSISEKGWLKMLSSFSKSLGFSTTNLDEYKKSFNNRHGNDPDVSALLDLNNRVVAIAEGGNVVENMTEEIAHLAVEAYSDQNSIVGALVEIDQTPEYSQWASIYRNKYASQFEGNELGLEDAVRKEILGKVIARNVLEGQFQNTEVQTIWERFLGFIRSVFKASHRKTIDKITNDLKNALETGNTSNFGTQIEGEGVFYSINKLNDEIVESIKGTTKLINSLATLSERNDGRGVRTTISERNIPKVMGQTEFISSVKDITDTIETNLKELGIKVNSNRLSAIDRTRAETFKAIVDNNLSQYYTLLEEVDSESLQSAKDALIKKIGLLSTESTKMASRFRKVDDELFDNMLNEIAERHNMDETAKEDMKSLFKGTLKDISRINSTFGLISESSNPFLSLMATIVSDLKATTARKSQEQINEILKLADDKKWDAKIQAGILEYDEEGKPTGFVETGLNQGALEKARVDNIITLISEYKGVDEKEARGLYDTKNVDDIFESEEGQKLLRESEKKFREENIVDRNTQEDIQEREEMNGIADVSEGYIESIREDKRTIFSILKDSKYVLESGEIDASLRTEEDKFLMDREMVRLKSKASPLDQNLEIRYGLQLKKVSDLTDEERASLPYYSDDSMREFFNKALANPNRTIVLPLINKEELPFESRYVLDHFNLNFARQIKFSERPDSNASDNYIDALRKLESEGDFLGALEFAKENGSIVFTDAYYDQLSGAESYTELVENSLEGMEEEDLFIVTDLLNNLKELSSKRSEFLKSYRSSRNIMQISAGNISTPERQAFKKLEEDIPAIKRDINKKLKKYGVELPVLEYSSDFILNTNEAFEAEYSTSGIKSRLTFALNEMSDNNAKDVRNFEAHVAQSLRPNSKSDKKYDGFLENLRGSALYENIISLETEDELVERLTFEYTKTRLPAYFKSQIPTEWVETEGKIASGEIKLSELVQNNLPISSLVTIQPNFSWSDLSYNKGKVNPEYKKSFGGNQPKMSKYKNQAWFDKYGITEEQWQEAEDITQLTATRNQNQFEFNQTMIALRKENDKRYGYEGNIYLAPQLSTTAYQKFKTATKAGGVKSALKDSLRDVIMNRVDELDYGETLDGTISGIEAVKIPPTYYRKKLEDANSISRDTLGSYLLDTVKANEHEARVEMSGKARALINKASESKFSDSSLLRNKKRIVKEGQVSEAVKKLKDAEDYHFYGIKQSRRMEVDFMGKKVDLTRLITKFRSLSVFTNLAFNPLVSTTSFTTGVVFNVVDRLSGGIYSNLAQNEANKVLLQDSTKFVGQDGKLTINSRLNTLMETFGMKNVEQRFNESASTRLARIFTESPFKLDELANLAVVPRVLYSTLFDHRLVVSKDNDGKDIYRILDFNQFKVHARNNGMTTKSEITSAWAKTKPFFDMLDTSDAVTKPTEEYLKYFTEEDFKQHVNTISIKAIQQNQRVDGMISDIDKTPAQRDVFLNLLMQHKAWFPIIMSQQFKNSGFNFSRGRFEEGYVRTGADFLANLVRNYRDPRTFYKEWMSSANDQQKANLKRAVAMAGVLGSLIAMSIAFAGADDDDDSVLEDFARLITYRTTSEVQSASLMGFYSTSKSVLESPVTALSTFDDQFKFLKALGSVSSDTYKQDVWEKFVKVTPFKRISQMSDLGKTTDSWLYFNREEMWYLDKDNK